MSNKTLPYHTIPYHFDNKITNIRDKLNIGVPTTTNQQFQDEQSIYVLKPATEEEIRRIIMKSPNKVCGLDPIPIWLLKSLPNRSNYYLS